MIAIKINPIHSALDYAAIGWQIIPLHTPAENAVPGFPECSCGKPDCQSIGKHPRTPNGLKDASTDPKVIAEWWKKWPDANVGIVTGAGSGIVVLDIDPRHCGNESIQELQNCYGRLPLTTEAATGGGGFHSIFRHPGYPVKNSSGKLGKGLDIRGDGGYIVAPPSIHVSGKNYEWNIHPTDQKPSDIPKWMIDALASQPQSTPRHLGTTLSDDGLHWLGKALARCTNGSRNETGLWLAVQLRDSGLAQSAAERIMLDYQSRVPVGDSPYTTSEALASLRSAYSTPPRDPAKNLNAKPMVKPIPPQTKKPTQGASAELSSYLSKITSGEISNLSFPWPQLTKLTQSLIPGSATVVCGDPGVGKTFWVLECLQHWHDLGVECAAFFVEKDRTFHTMRLLAQLECDGRFVDFEWIKQNKATVEDASRKHAERIDALGKLIHSEPIERVTLESLAAWVHQMASAGKRILVIDPITAADAGKDRWMADDIFVDKVNKIIVAHSASLILVTHPKKGNRQGGNTAGDIAAGAAFNRFVDVNLWLHKPKKPKAVLTHGRFGGVTKQTLELFVQMLKTRNGRGAGKEIGFCFDHTLRFCEQGLVAQELDETNNPLDETPHAPRARAVQDPFADDIS